MDDHSVQNENQEEQKESEEVEEKGLKKSSKRKAGEAEELKARIEELENQLKRAIADYRNLEKRFEEEKRDFIKFANRELLTRLLPSFDSLFLAEKYISDEGIKVTIKHLQESLKDVGVERVKTENEMFDAEKMEAVSTEEGEDGKVLEELRPGFTLNGKLVRPAQVKVGKAATSN